MSQPADFPIWVTRDRFANEVYLFREDLDHILDGHPEMAGRESEIKGIVEQPTRIHEAGTPKTAAFLGPSTSSNPEGIRVIVGYSSEMYISGNTSGIVVTAYPIDSIQYNKPRIGGRIYPPKTETSI